MKPPFVSHAKTPLITKNVRFGSSSGWEFEQLVVFCVETIYTIKISNITERFKERNSRMWRDARA